MLPKFFQPAFAPTDHLPYGFTWYDWFQANAADIPALAGDMIAHATITSAPSLTIGSVTIDPTGMIAYATISGGTDGTSYVLTCTITSESGLVAASEQTLQCTVAAR